MAIYHLSVQIIGRSSGKSAVASSAYRAGEKIKDERIGETYDYTKKRGVDYTEILTPANAPEWASDRSRLWNEVEKIETSKNSRLAREVNIALPKELTRDQQIELIRNFVKEQFVDKGMVADVALHNLAGENPHAHVMMTVRPFNEDSTWGAKSKKEYMLDDTGEKIKLPSGQFKSRKIDSVNWNEKETLGDWRKEWASQTNKALEKAGVLDRVDHRSYKDQGSKQIPQIHVGVHATAMERRDIKTELGDVNRGIIELNTERDSFNTTRRNLIHEEKQYLVDVKAYEVEVEVAQSTMMQQPSSKEDPLDEIIKEMETAARNRAHENINGDVSAPISEPKPVHPQPKPLEPVQQEPERSVFSMDTWKKEISQVKKGTTQVDAQLQSTRPPIMQQPPLIINTDMGPTSVQPEMMKISFSQARTDLGKQEEVIYRIDGQLRMEDDNLRRYKDYDRQIGEAEARLGNLSRFKPWQWDDIKTWEKAKARVIGLKQDNFGETKREDIEHRINKLTSEKRVQENKLPELKSRYNRAKVDHYEYTMEVKALSRQKDFSKSKDLLERLNSGETLTDTETKLVNSFSKELGIKKIPIKSMEMGWER